MVTWKWSAKKGYKKREYPFRVSFIIINLEIKETRKGYSLFCTKAFLSFRTMLWRDNNYILTINKGQQKDLNLEKSNPKPFLQQTLDNPLTTEERPKKVRLIFLQKCFFGDTAIIPLSLIPYPLSLVCRFFIRFFLPEG